MRWEPVPLQESPVELPGGQFRRRRITRRGKALRRATWAVLKVSVCLLAVVGAGSVLRATQPTPALVLETPTVVNGQAALGSASVERRLGFVTVTGTAVSRAKRPLTNVEAVVELLDAKKQTIQVESALTTFSPLQPGGTTPFRVEIPDDSRVVSYRIRFKQLLGASLN